MIGPQVFVVPDLPEPIRAIRAWRLAGPNVGTPFGADVVSLISMNGETWPPQKALTARCVRADGPCSHSPSATKSDHGGSGCGIYGFKTLEDAFAEYGHVWGVVFGEVLLSGEVWEHESGYRSERARVAAIYRVVTTDPADVDRAAAVYRVPVVDVELDKGRLDEAMERRGWVRAGAAFVTMSADVGNYMQAMAKAAASAQSMFARYGMSVTFTPRRSQWRKPLLWLNTAAMAWCGTWAGVYAVGSRWGYAAFHGSIAALHAHWFRREWRKP